MGSVLPPLQTLAVVKLNRQLCAAAVRRLGWGVGLEPTYYAAPARLPLLSSWGELVRTYEVEGLSFSLCPSSRCANRRLLLLSGSCGGREPPSSHGPSLASPKTSAGVVGVGVCGVGYVVPPLVGRD